MSTSSSTRTAAARQSIRAWSASMMVKPARKQHSRATLEGLEVRELCITAWLAAGGCRRSAQRIKQ